MLKNKVTGKLSGSMFHQADKMIIIAIIVNFFFTGFLNIGIVMYALTFAMYALIACALYMIRKNSVWFKRAFFTSVGILALTGLSIILNNFILPQFLDFITIIRLFLADMLLVAIFFLIDFALEEISAANKREYKHRIRISGIIYFVYVFLKYLAAIMVPSLIYLLYMSVVFVFFAIVVFLILGFMNFNKEEIMLEKDNDFKCVIASIVFFIIILGTSAGLIYADSIKGRAEFKALDANKTGSTSETRQKLVNLGLTETYANLLNDEEVEKYVDAISVEKIEGKKEVAAESEKETTEAESKSTESETTAENEEKQTTQETTVSQLDVEQADMYVIQLSDGNTRIITFFKTTDDGENFRRYKEAILLNIRGTGEINLTDAYGKAVDKRKDDTYEADFDTLEINVNTKQRLGNKTITYSGPTQDETNYEADDKNSNILAMVYRNDNEYTDQMGYIGFTLADGQLNGKTITMKYIMQSELINYPVVNMEECLYKYTDGFYDNVYKTMKVTTWK